MMKRLKIFLVSFLAICTINSYSQTSMWGNIVYHGWPKDSVRVYYACHYSPVWDGDSSRIINFINNGDELIFKSEYRKLDSSNHYYIYEYADSYHYFENDKLVLSHDDFYGKNLNDNPISEYFEWIHSMSEALQGQFRIYLTAGDKTYNYFAFQNLDKAISLKGAQLHAVQRFGDFYVESVLLFVDGGFHIHSIYRSHDSDVYIRKNHSQNE